MRPRDWRSGGDARRRTSSSSKKRRPTTSSRRGPSWAWRRPGWWRCLASARTSASSAASP